MSTIRLPTGRATHGISGKKTALPQNLLRAFCIEAIKKTLTRVNQISLFTPRPLPPAVRAGGFAALEPEN
jgi:hypothetical protein